MIELELVVSWSHSELDIPRLPRPPNVYVSSPHYSPHRSSESRSTPFVDTYFRNFPKDTLQTKLLVSLIFSLEIVQSICGLVDGFKMFGSHWGDPSEPTKLGLSFLSMIGLGAISESSTATSMFDDALLSDTHSCDQLRWLFSGSTRGDFG
jgi:hypothetical protein